jgi:hypothetical protein
MESEREIGWLRYEPPWDDGLYREKHEAQLCVVLVLTREQFSDLWERGPGRAPQSIFAEIDGFEDEYQYAPGSRIWEINAAEHAEVQIKACTFQNIAGLIIDSASIRHGGRFRPRGGEVITDMHAFVRQHLNKRHDSNKPQHSAILKELYACIARECTRPGDVGRGELEEEFANVDRLVIDLDLALNRELIREEEAVGHQGNPSKKRGIWYRGDPVAAFQEGLKSPSRRKVDKQDLSAVAQKYLQAPYLRCDLLEWIIVDAFVLFEIQEFGETIKQGSGFGSLLRYWARDGRLRSGASLFWPLVLTPMVLAGWIAGLAYVTPHAGESTLVALLVFGAYVLFFMWLTGRPIFVSRQDQKRSSPMLLQEMMRVYALLDFSIGVTSPHAIRSALLELQNKGAIWDPAALAILDTAASRARPA